jgi:hypothetical protein
MADYDDDEYRRCVLMCAGLPCGMQVCDANLVSLNAIDVLA